MKVGDHRKFKKQATEINKIKREWNEIQGELEKKRYAEKEVANVMKESKKLEDLEFSKAHKPPGPFTTHTEVQQYIESEVDDMKLKRIYVEVRFALPLPESAEVFRLRRNEKYLTLLEYADNLTSYLEK